METKENPEQINTVNTEVQDAQVSATSNAVDAEATGTHQEHIREALELLYQHFPKAFIKEGDCKPLKVGILEDLKGRISDIEGLSISKVRAAVRVYTTRLRYLYAVREGAKRIDLDGVEGEAVTAEHAEYARTRFSEINAKRRPAKPKKPHANQDGARNNKFNKNRRPMNKRGGDNQGQNQGRYNNNRRNGYNQGQGNNQRRFNNNNNQRRFEAAKESDIRVGRFVFISSSDQSYVKGTVAEPLNGDKVSVTLQNGLTVPMPLERIFISNSPARPNNGRPNNKRPFDRNNNGGNRRYNNYNRNNGNGQGHAGHNHNNYNGGKKDAE